ncbi:MAG: hypothetical protein IKX46_03325 [Verrucomicrobia bacterium]|nr:hypothetical protein [Verrucomicrobiota bacterium]
MNGAVILILLWGIALLAYVLIKKMTLRAFLFLSFFLLICFVWGIGALKTRSSSPYVHFCHLNSLIFNDLYETTLTNNLDALREKILYYQAHSKDDWEITYPDTDFLIKEEISDQKEDRETYEVIIILSGLLLLLWCIVVFIYPLIRKKGWRYLLLFLFVVPIFLFYMELLGGFVMLNETANYKRMDAIRLNALYQSSLTNDIPMLRKQIRYLGDHYKEDPQIIFEPDFDYSIDDGEKE